MRASDALLPARFTGADYREEDHERRFEYRCWGDIITPDILQVYSPYWRKGFAGEPGLIGLPGRAAPPVEIAGDYPSSCGEHAHAVIEPIKRLFAAPRRAPPPIFYPARVHAPQILRRDALDQVVAQLAVGSASTNLWPVCAAVSHREVDRQSLSRPDCFGLGFQLYSDPQEELPCNSPYSRRHLPGRCRRHHHHRPGSCRRRFCRRRRSGRRGLRHTPGTVLFIPLRLLYSDLERRS
jgi:hypothetical protein